MAFDPTKKMDLIVTVDGPSRPAPEPEAPSDGSSITIMIDGVLTSFPRQAGERIKAMSPEEFTDFQQIRDRSRVDTIFCGTFLLGLSLSENPHRSFTNFY